MALRLIVAVGSVRPVVQVGVARCRGTVICQSKFQLSFLVIPCCQIYGDHR